MTVTEFDNLATHDNSTRTLEGSIVEAMRLLCGDQRRVDDAAIQRGLSGAQLAWPGPVDDRWWKWLLEVGRGLNYATRLIDATTPDIFELIRHGVVAVTFRTGDDPKLLVVRGHRSNTAMVTTPDNSSPDQTLNLRQLNELLGNNNPTALRRWVILDSISDDLPSSAAAHDDHGDVGAAGSAHQGIHRSPWSRLWEFMQPEWSDLWIVLVFALFTGVLSLITPIAIEALVNTVAFGTLLQPLLVLSLILLVFLSFAASLRFLQRFVVELIQRRLLARVAGRLAWQLPRARFDDDHAPTPELLNRFFDIVTVQKIVAQLALDGLKIVLTVVLGMIVLAFYHPWLLAFDFMLLVPIAFNVFLLGRGAVRTSIVESQSKYAVAHWLEDLVRCPLLFKSSGGAEFALSRADRLTTDYLVARQKHYRILTRQIVAGLTLEALASALLLGLGGFLVIQRQLTLGQLVAAELIVTLIVASVAKLDKQFEGFYDLLTSIDKLGHLFDIPVESPRGVVEFGGRQGARINIRNVSFQYAHGPRVFDNRSFAAAPGDAIAIVGDAASGKSTLLDLLYRLRTPTKGRIELDDTDLNDIRPDILREQVSLVRGLEVLTTTLGENIHLDRPQVSGADVRQALRCVGFEDAKHGTSWPLETMLSHDGRPLSDRQLRRVVLARALVTKPRLLLIDGLLDGFSDEEGLELLSALRKQLPACTIVLVTGRTALQKACKTQWKL